MKIHFLLLFATVCLVVSCSPPDTKKYSTWGAYAGSKEGNRYSSLEQITPENVGQLKVAWTFSSHDKDPENHTQDQCNPIVVDGVLYGISPQMKLFALNASTGQVKWLFDPASADSSTIGDPKAFFKINRGVVYWSDEQQKDKRIIYGVGARLYAINADNGKQIMSFGASGFINLLDDLDREPGTFNPYLNNTTPGVVYKDLYIVGARLEESADAAPGHVRAYNIRTGKREWIFHTIPHPGEFGYETWPNNDDWKRLGGANNWAGMALDENTGTVFIPTGTVSGDFYGGVRKGQNLFGNSLIALDAETGKYKWHYQVIHHDLWDRDLPANPNLVTLHIDGKTIQAVAQITKHGYVFVFDRATGKPVFPIEEKPVSQNALPGEFPWPTQPIPTLPEQFARHSITADDVSDLTPETHQYLMEKFNQVKDNTAFAPPSKEGVWIFPGYDGGGEWGGAAVDAETSIMYVNASELPWALHMVETPKNQRDHSQKGIGKSLYYRNCMTCHGPERRGNGNSFPSLLNLQKKFTPTQITQLLDQGRNRMPSFKHLSEDQKQALLTFLLDLPEKEGAANYSLAAEEKSILDEIPYNMTGYNRFLDQNGYPGIKPPWGTLNAIDLNTGKILWKVPHGEYPELTAKGIPVTGTENYGGPLVTKGGLVFIAGTKDERIRAYDKKTGKVLWQAQLPAAGFATPATYEVDGVQYVVIACGGGKIGNKSGDEYVAFALKNE